MQKIKKIIIFIYHKSSHLLSITKNRGKIRYCPICQKAVPYFIPLPKHYKNNLYIENKLFTCIDAETLNFSEYSCPKCGSSDRERLYILFLKKYLLSQQNAENIEVVHFAPENALSNFIRNLPLKVYRTADLMMKNVDDRIDLTKLDIYPTNSFTFFICSHMLEHIIDDQKALSELYRILAPSGQGILMVPILTGLEKTYEDLTIISEEERLKHFGQEDHVRIYSKNSYLQLLSDIGFTVKEYTVDHFTHQEFITYGISPKSVLYVVEKS